MKKFRNFIVWSLVFIGLLLAFDLMMVRSSGLPPVLRGIQRFYVDFRGRILNLATKPAPGSIERVIEAADRPVKVEVPATRSTGQRYLYADAEGTLHFADSLSEVPVAFRSAAQPLQE